MEHNSITPSKDYRFDTESRLTDGLESLLGAALQRQVWLLFFDDETRLLEPIMPMNDHPASPDELCDTVDLGSVPFAHVLVYRASSIIELMGAANMVLVWERPGDDALTDTDVKWNTAIAAEASRTGLALRAQFVLHDGGIKLLDIPT